jgi:hypothetical protein
MFVTPSYRSGNGLECWIQFLEAIPVTLIITTFTMGLIPTEQEEGHGLNHFH